MPIPLRLKVEINSREHFFAGFAATSPTNFPAPGCEHCIDVRRVGICFDLATALKHPAFNPDRIIEVFAEYMNTNGHKATRAQFEKNIAGKQHDPEMVADMSPLLSAGVTWDIRTTVPLVSSRPIERLPGDGTVEYDAGSILPIKSTAQLRSSATHSRLPLVVFLNRRQQPASR